jgi:hypothetical protein
MNPDEAVVRAGAIRGSCTLQARVRRVPSVVCVSDFVAIGAAFQTRPAQAGRAFSAEMLKISLMPRDSVRPRAMGGVRRYALVRPAVTNRRMRHRGRHSRHDEA